MADEIRIDNPLILEIHASITDSAEPHVDWSIGYAPEADDDGEGRFILARLHAGAGDGSVTVEIGAAQVSGPMAHITEAEDSIYRTQLAASPSLGMLYGLARITTLGLLGTIDSVIPLPWEPPTPTLTRLVRPALTNETS